MSENENITTQKPTRFSKSSSKREIYSNTNVAQETNKTPLKQPNLIPRAVRQRTTTKPQSLKKSQSKAEKIEMNNSNKKKTAKVNEAKKPFL